MVNFFIFIFSYNVLNLLQLSLESMDWISAASESHKVSSEPSFLQTKQSQGCIPLSTPQYQYSLLIQNTDIELCGWGWGRDGSHCRVMGLTLHCWVSWILSPLTPVSARSGMRKEVEKEEGVWLCALQKSPRPIPKLGTSGRKSRRDSK